MPPRSGSSSAAGAREAGSSAPGPALPRWVVLLLPPAVGGAVLGGLLLEGQWSALLLLAVLVVLGWLAYRSWAVLSRPARLLRMVVLGALAAVVVLRLTQ